MTPHRDADSSSPTAAPTDVERLLDIMKTLRSDRGCPWDREQTLDSLKPYLVEEAYELLDAIESGDPERHREEMGDLLLQIVFQAQIRDEQEQFDFDDVARGICNKLVRRHPHVFADRPVAGTDEVLRNWEDIKAKERAKGADSAMSGVPRSLPALLKAQQVQARAARVGFDWERMGDVAAKVEEEIEEVRSAVAAGDSRRVREEIGDLLFAVVNLARFLKVNAEDALAGATGKFVRRFCEMARTIEAEGKRLNECPLAEMDRAWEAAKRAERAAAAGAEAKPETTGAGG